MLTGVDKQPMKKILVAAGNFDITHEVRQSLGSTYEIYEAYSHGDTLYMLRQQPVDVILIDAAMFDRTTGMKTFLALMTPGIATPIVIYSGSQTLKAVAQNAIAQMNSRQLPQLVHISALDKNSLIAGIYDALKLPLPALEPLGESDDDNHLYDTSPQQSRMWRDEEFQTLSALSRSLTEVLDLSEVLNRVVQAARHLTDADEGILLMPDSETDQFYLRAEVGLDSEVAQQFRVKLQDSFAGMVFSTGEPVLIGAGSPLKLKTQYFVNSLLYVPVSLKNERIGVLGVNNRQKRAVFNHRHQELLMNLAQYAAIAIENARVHGQSVQRAKELRSLVDACEVINSSLSMETTLFNISERLADLLSCGRVDIYQWTRPKTTKQRTNGTSAAQGGSGSAQGAVVVEAQEQPAVLGRYHRSIWKVTTAPAIPLKNRPALVSALRGKMMMVSVGQEDMQPEVERLNRVGAHSMLVLPLMADEHPLGMILAYYTRPTTMPPTDAIIHAQTIGMHGLSVLVDHGDASHSSLFREAGEINRQLGSAWCELALVGQDRRSLLILVTLGAATWLNRTYVDPYVEHTDEMMNMVRSQQPVWASSNGDTSTLGSLSMLEKFNGRALLGLPLVYQNEVTGFIMLVDTQHQRRFSEREIDLARAIMSQAATAIQNAHLLRELEGKVAELRTAQDRLVRAARLSAMGELSAAIAHQVNNPLTTIVLDAELVLLSSSLDDKARASVDAILRSGKKAASVVRRLLTSVRPEARAEIAPIPIMETIEETLSLMRSHVQRQGVQLALHTDFDEAPIVMGTRDDLGDLWLNLMLNANEALIGRANGKMGVDVSSPDEHYHVRVVIWDNGGGIPDNIREHIFEPFFTTKPVGEGTGLGLHICRQIIDRLHGTIEVESNPRIGTQFIVRLPLIRS